MSEVEKRLETTVRHPCQGADEVPIGRACLTFVRWDGRSLMGRKVEGAED
jgi:hypothetical protein